MCLEASELSLQIAVESLGDDVPHHVSRDLPTMAVSPGLRNLTLDSMETASVLLEGKAHAIK